MNTKIELALNILYQREISSRDQLMNEILRVKMLLKSLEGTPIDTNNQEGVFQLMKKTTENELGFFPADRDDFYEINNALKDVDLIDFALEVYKNDRMGIVVSPTYLNEYISTRIQKLQPKKILITEAEKHLSGLRELVNQNQDCEITLTTQLEPMNRLLKLAFGENLNVAIQFESIYTECLPDEKFDYIYSFPALGYKPEELGKSFITRESDGIATQNMLEHLNESGTLDIILPAKITFAGREYEELRSYITDSFFVESIYILPEGTFKPATSIKTYLFTITKQSQNHLTVGTLELKKDIFELAEQKALPLKEFLSHADWRVELLLSEDDEVIQRFKSSNLDKIKLKEVSEVFRGKSILKKDTAPGSIGVLNISNIIDGEIDYSEMDTIEEDERKIKRYELIDGDVVLSCRGTVFKSAVFTKHNDPIIASANLIVVRPKEKILGQYIKIFFESPIGLAMIKSFQRGTTIMNLNHSDIMEMEIPIIPISKQEEMIEQYQKELSNYKKSIKEAESRWTKVKNVLYKKLT